MQTRDGACWFNHTSLSLCSTHCCCHVHQPGMAVSAVFAALPLPGLVSAVFMGTGTGEQSSPRATLSVLPGCSQPLCFGSTFQCQYLLVAFTLKRKMQDWLTWAASTPVKHHWVLNIEYFYSSLVFHMESISFSLSKDSLILFFKSQNYPHLFTLVYSGNHLPTFYIPPFFFFFKFLLS